MTRRPDGPFYYVWKISDLFCKETGSEPPNISIKLDLTASGRFNMGVYLDNITFINIDVVQ